MLYFGTFVKAKKMTMSITGNAARKQIAIAINQPNNAFIPIKIGGIYEYKRRPLTTTYTACLEETTPCIFFCSLAMSIGTFSNLKLDTSFL